MVHSLPLLLLVATARAGDAPPPPPVVRAPLQALWPAPAGPPKPPVQVLPGRLDLHLAPDGPELRLRADFYFELLDDAPLALPIVGADLTLRAAHLDGHPVALPPDPDGWRRLAGTLAPGPHHLKLAGSVSTPASTLDLPMVEASRTHVTVDDGWVLSSPDGVQRDAAALDLAPTPRLRLSWHEPRPARPPPRVVQASAATSLRVDATGVLARSRIRFRVRHQPTDTLRVALPQVDDLQVEGSALRSWRRQGGEIVLHLVEPVLGGAEVTLSWRTGAPGREGGPVALPRPVTTSGRLDDGFVRVLAGDQGTPVVLPGTGLAAIPDRAVASWGRGLVPGAPLLSMQVTGPGPVLRVRVLDRTPADEPPTVVDDARITVTYTAEGRALLRCRYQVRNDRRQYLGVTLPAGARLLGARVAGEVVQTVIDEGYDGGEDSRRLFIPLEKSVETLQGLVRFPVEVMLLVDAAPWARRGRRALTAPALDAPVAAARWELFLPAGLRIRDVQGDARIVDEARTPTAGLTYARASALLSPGVGELREEQSQEAWNQAYRAYKDNDFERARTLLERALALDPDNVAAQALEDNVDLLLGDRDAEGQEAQARRIRALARAKTGDMAAEQAALEEALRQAERAGDTDRAQELLERYTKVTRKLVQVEDEEMVEQKTRLAEARKKRKDLARPTAEDAVGVAGPPSAPDDDRAGAAPGAWPDADDAGYGSAITGSLSFTGRGEGGGGFGVATMEARGGAIDARADADRTSRAGDEPEPVVDQEAAGRGPLESDIAWEPDQVDADLVVDTVTVTTEGRGVAPPRRARTRPGEARHRSEGEAAPSLPTPGVAVAPARGGVEPTPPPTRPGAAGGFAPPPPSQPAALSMDPTVTAAPLITDVPRAGTRLLLQQHLLAPGQALSTTLIYRRTDATPRPRS